MGSVVRCRQVSRSFGTTPAAVDVSLDVRPGEVFTLLGHNGAGKTTLIRLINGLLRPDTGAIETFGLDAMSYGHVIRRRTGVLTTYPGLDEYLSPAENLAVYAAINGLDGRATRSRIAALLTRLEIDPMSSAPARGLSAGLKQRVALARALIHDPELLLLDEPTANLDPIAAREVRDLVRQLAQEGRTVVFSTHNLGEAQSLGDRMAVLRRGQVVALGSLDELARGHLAPGLEVAVDHRHVELAMSALAQVLDCDNTTIHDGRIRVTGASPALIPILVRTLVEAGVDVHEAVRTLPSLEDVYLELHQPGVTE